MQKKAVAVVLLLIIVFSAVIILVNFDNFAPRHAINQVYEPTIPSADEKVVCIAFDDGWKSHVEVALALEAYNFTATFPIVTSYVGYSAYMSWQEIASLGKRGHDIVSHTHTHANLSAVDSAVLEAELVQSREILRSKGYAADVLVYPYGEAADNTTVRNAVAKTYLLARGTQTGKCDVTFVNRYNVNSYGIYSNTSLTVLASYLSGTKGNNVTLLEYNRVGDGDTDTTVSMTNFQEQMQYLKDNGYTVMTISELFLKEAQATA